MAPSKFIQGKTYLTVVCPNDACKGIIPIAEAREVHFSGQGKLQVGCPFCGETTEHAPTEAKNRKLEVLPPTAQ